MQIDDRLGLFRRGLLPGLLRGLGGPGPGHPQRGGGERLRAQRREARDVGGGRLGVGRGRAGVGHG